MNVYLMVVLCVFVLGFIAKIDTYNRDFKIKKDVLQNTYSILGAFSVLLIISILVCVSGFRYFVGSDFGSYYGNFKYYVKTPIDIHKNNEIILYVIAKLVSKCGGDAQAYIFMCSLITLSFFIITISKFSDNVQMSFILLIFLGMFLGSFNAVRQYLACAFIMIGLQYIFNDNWKKWLVFVGLAFLCHSSAVFLIPLYWFIRMKDRKKYLIILLIVAVVAFFSYDRIFAVIDNMKGLEDRSVGDRIYSQSTVSIYRVAVSWAPVLLYFFTRRNFEPENKKENILTNSMFLVAALQTASMNSAYLARFCIYATSINTIAIPTLVKRQNIQYRKIVEVIVYVLYFLYWLQEARGDYVVNYEWFFGH